MIRLQSGSSSGNVNCHQLTGGGRWSTIEWCQLWLTRYLCKYDFFIVIIFQEIAPPGLLKIIRCNCKASSRNPCNSRMCSCFANGLTCVSACGDCRGTSCSNLPVASYEDDYVVDNIWITSLFRSFSIIFSDRHNNSRGFLEEYFNLSQLHFIVVLLKVLMKNKTIIC